LIFVTVGTHHQPFIRMLEAIAEIADRDFVVQYGAGSPPPGVGRAEAFLPFDQMLDCYREAAQVITHAGVGSILCATREGHTPLVVPRQQALGEHVDDHQVELTRALAERGSVVAIWDTADLARLLAESPPRRERAEAQVPPLCKSVRGALIGEPDQPSAA
jgi:UDP-N-acetylglucosamine transferase subunit ALG13